MERWKDGKDGMIGMMEHVATDLFRRAEIGWKIGKMERLERWNWLEDWNDGMCSDGSIPSS